MNLAKLGISGLIIFLNLALLLILLYVIRQPTLELFTNYPQQVNPMAEPKSNPEKDSANNNYASILLYIQNNPSKSFKFIQDIKQKFFDSSCSIKSDIDFNKIAQMPNGMVF
jgi:hypothetical protein